jgi:hypothetical protein
MTQDKLNFKQRNKFLLKNRIEKSIKIMDRWWDIKIAITISSFFFFGGGVGGGEKQ